MHTAVHLIAKLGQIEENSPSSLPNAQDMDRKSRAAAIGRLLVITTGAVTKVVLSEYGDAKLLAVLNHWMH